MKETERVGKEVGLGVESDEVVAEGTIDAGGCDGASVEDARVGAGWWLRRMTGWLY